MKTEEIENYLLNRMAEEERSQFERELELDENLLHEVESYAAVFASFDQIRRDNLQTRFKEKRNPSASVISINRNSNLNIYWKIAAAIIAIVLIGGYFLYNPTINNQTLYAEYYTPYPNIADASVRSGNDTKDEMWTAYDNGNYEKAFALFEKASISDPENYTIKFYLGISALERKEFIVANEAFFAVAATTNASLNQQANWYLALSYLAENRLLDCQEQLKKIEDSNSSYAGRATALLTDLD